MLTAVWSAVFLPVSLLFGGDLVGVNWGPFVVGLLTLGVGSLGLRPGKQWREDDEGGHADGRGESRVWRLVDRLPPFRDRAEPLRNDGRLSDGLKLLFGAVCMLLASFLLEAVLGVAVRPSRRGQLGLRSRQPSPSPSGNRCTTDAGEQPEDVDPAERLAARADIGWGLVHTIPDDFLDGFADAVDRGAFPEYDVLRDPEGRLALFVAGNYPLQGAEGCIAAEDGEGL